MRKALLRPILSVSSSASPAPSVCPFTVGKRSNQRSPGRFFSGKASRRYAARRVGPLEVRAKRRENQFSPKTTAATRSSRFGRKIVISNGGRYQAINTPPPYPCQNCTMTMSPAVQLSNVPRFFCGGQKAKPILAQTKAAKNGKRYQASQPSPQMPSIFSITGSISPNIFRTSNQYCSPLSEISNNDNAIKAIDPATPARNRRIPRCQ